jgi:hypothetical protein
LKTSNKMLVVLGFTILVGLIVSLLLWKVSAGPRGNTRTVDIVPKEVAEKAIAS